MQVAAERLEKARQKEDKLRARAAALERTKVVYGVMVCETLLVYTDCSEGKE